MKISNELYDTIKYVICIILPAVQAAVLAISNILQWSDGAVVSDIIIVIQVLLSSIFCISNATYKGGTK